MALAKAVLRCEENNVAQSEGWSRKQGRGRYGKLGKDMGEADAQNVPTKWTPWREESLEDGDTEGFSDATCWFLVVGGPHISVP